MENTLINKLDMIAEEFPECYSIHNPDWVFSDIKNVVNEPLKLTTNKSVKIIKNDFDLNILA
jgi:uncharacterized protein YacL